MRLINIFNWWYSSAAITFQLDLHVLAATQKLSKMEEFNEHEEGGCNEEVNHDDEEVANEDEFCDEDAEGSYSEKVIRQIESYDPNLVKLKIEHRSYFPHDNDWQRDGKSIGRNTHLKELDFFYSCDEVTKEDIEKFLRGVSDNRSIRKLRFYCCNLFNGELFSILILQE